jgi:hypothetical protein
MQETLSFFMFLLQVKDKNEETKQVLWRRQQNPTYKHSDICGPSVLCLYGRASCSVLHKLRGDTLK